MQVEVNGVELAVQTSGRVEDPAVLLVGVSMLSWPAEFCRALTGRRVVRYDPRDVGRSTYVDPDHPDYDLRDLVDDAAGLLSALEIDRAHVVGLGVGGFIAQLLALDHPDRVATLTLVSTRPVAPGPVDDDLPDHDPEVMAALFSGPEPDWTDRAEVVRHLTRAARLLSGAEGVDEPEAAERAAATFDRTRPTAAAQRASHQGTVFAVIDCRPRWRERLAQITAPTLVVHGDQDPFFPYGNAVALAEEIPGAELHALPGVGAALPRAAWTTLAAAVLRHTSR